MEASTGIIEAHSIVTSGLGPRAIGGLMVQIRSAWVIAVALGLGAQAVVFADTLVLRDGRRFEGLLVGVRGTSIEFEHRGGREDGQVRRYDRSDVRTIQIDELLAGNRYRDDGYRDDRLTDTRPRAGLRERSVNVSARTPWTDSGVDVRGGQEIFFVATGEVRWGPGRRDGAAGERNSPSNQGRPMPDRNAAALIGKIGENGDPFFIGGTTQAIRVRGVGRLYLGINDDFLDDNTGALRVVISY